VVEWAAFHLSTGEPLSLSHPYVVKPGYSVFASHTATVAMVQELEGCQMLPAFFLAEVHTEQWQVGWGLTLGNSVIRLGPLT